VVRDLLRDAFTAWGLPDHIRVDNGHPWGSWSDLPRALPLWLIGLGVDVIWNDACCPEENGKVERMQGVTKQWAEPGRCSDRAQLSRRLEWAVRIQREVYPAIRGRTRLEAYPALGQRRRPYRRDQEEAWWDQTRIDAFLSGGVWQRLVSRTGQISLNNRNYRVGRGYAGRVVSVRFEAAGRQWVVQDARGQELARHAAEQITRERIMELDVMHRRINKRSDSRSKPGDGEPGVQHNVG
jgi:hypothetical protein